MISTRRLDLRLPDEADRARFVGRSRGYATDAALALLEFADGWVEETIELLAMIDPRNSALSHVAPKLGFRHWDGPR